MRASNTIGGGVHSDFHALWINPADSRHMYAGHRRRRVHQPGPGVTIGGSSTTFRWGSSTM